MVKTADKIIFGVLIIMLVGISSVLIAALNSNSVSNTEIKNSAPKVLLKEISSDEAKVIAVNAVPGLVGEVEIENQNGQLIYEVEIKDGNFNREVRINLQGEIIGIETEEDKEVTSAELEKIDGIITEAQAIEIALAKVDGVVLEIEAEQEDGRLLYEVEISGQGNIAEVEIDAEPGEVLEIEWGEDEDDDEEDD